MAAFSQTASIEHREETQVIRVPNEYAFAGNEAKVFQDSAGRLILEPIYQANSSLQDLLDSWKPLSSEDALPEISKLDVGPFEL